MNEDLIEVAMKLRLIATGSMKSNIADVEALREALLDGFEGRTDISDSKRYPNVVNALADCARKAVEGETAPSNHIEGSYTLVHGHLSA